MYYILPPAPEPSEEQFVGLRNGESAQFPDPGAVFALPPEDPFPAIIIRQMISDTSPSTKDPDDKNPGDKVFHAFPGPGYAWPSPTHTELLTMNNFPHQTGELAGHQLKMTSFTAAPPGLSLGPPRPIGAVHQTFADAATHFQDEDLNFSGLHQVDSLGHELLMPQRFDSMIFLEGEDLNFSAVQNSTTAPANSWSNFQVALVDSNSLGYPQPQTNKPTCQICGREFKKPWNLKQHIRSKHLLERPYGCFDQLCGKRYSRKHDLKRHLKWKHGFIV
ncbi:hypothetical protein C8Q74DRAFT_1295464 [Fomes fomentarius]|nr:hypothetical protein C8Q74DRAFT_1295464 [Fomes fomentarius]